MIPVNTALSSVTVGAVAGVAKRGPICERRMVSAPKRIMNGIVQFVRSFKSVETLHLLWESASAKNSSGLEDADLGMA